MNVLDSFRLNGKTAVVTGPAGKYGRQIAEALAEAGANTILASRNLDAISKQAEEFRQKGWNAVSHQLDQADAESVQQLLDFVLKEYGKVDILVNNAVTRPMGDWSAPAENFAESMKVNADGLFLMVRTFGESMAEKGGGSIINIGSIQGMVGPDYTLYEGLDWGMPPDYFFHKGGMLQLTRFAAAKLGPRGVRVNTVSPGGMYTGQDEVFVKRYSARTFLGRMANDTDLKGIIVFLACDSSAYITGANIPVDGGYTAK